MERILWHTTSLKDLFSSNKISRTPHSVKPDSDFLPFAAALRSLWLRLYEFVDLRQLLIVFPEKNYLASGEGVRIDY